LAVHHVTRGQPALYYLSYTMYNTMTVMQTLEVEENTSAILFYWYLASFTILMSCKDFGSMSLNLHCCENLKSHNMYNSF